MSARRAPLPHFSALDANALRRWPLPGIAQGADKEERGSVLIVAGSREIPGAALLSATAAARAGAGKLLVASPQSAAHGIALAMPEARVIALDENRDGTLATSATGQLAAFGMQVNAVLVGPGLPEGSETTEFVLRLLPSFTSVPLILDASAMDAVMGEQRFNQPLLLTPHCGEMAHLTGHTKEALTDNPAEAAHYYAQEWGAVVALKGATTWIAQPDGQGWKHAGGHPGLATSGSGDVLAGLAVGLAARGASLTQACCWATVVHALVGQRLAKRIGTLGFLARELLPEIPAVLDSLAPGSARAERQHP